MIVITQRYIYLTNIFQQANYRNKQPFHLKSSKSLEVILTSQCHVSHRHTYTLLFSRFQSQHNEISLLIHAFHTLTPAKWPVCQDQFFQVQ